MKILNISAECYPAAKAGGLGDVTGALPKYLNRAGHEASVIIPAYHTEWILERKTKMVYEGRAPYAMDGFEFKVLQITDGDLGFDLFVVDIPGRFDRAGIYIDPWSGYSYWDEMDRFFNFQIAVLEWVNRLKKKPDILHCHDHHTGLVPFMITQCFRYQSLRSIPTVLTIHNGEYQGRYDYHNYVKLPAFELNSIGLLDWDGQINALASGIKCAWRVSTVSQGYLKELQISSNGLEKLLQSEKGKTTGVMNGIDVDIWNPSTDPYLTKTYTIRGVKSGKEANKELIYKEFNFTRDKPLISFIGRLVSEKGADLLPQLIREIVAKKIDINILVLGTGDPVLHKELSELRSKSTGFFNTKLEYNEGLAHRIYAGSDFLLMPSRVEPCGLNQMYAMRYGTVPVVRKTGGLADSVTDISENNGFGFTFEELSVDEIIKTIRRAIKFYNKKKPFSDNRKLIMKLDYSWERASKEYVSVYRQLM